MIMASGCTSQQQQQKVVYEGDVGGSGVNDFYIPVNASSVTVEISNVKTIQDPNFTTQIHELEIRALNVTGQNGQSAGNYINDIVDDKSFDNLTDGYNSTVALNGDIKSIAILSTDVKLHIKILA